MHGTACSALQSSGTDMAAVRSPWCLHVQIGFSDDMLLLSPRKQKRLHINLRKAGDAAADALRRQVYARYTASATCHTPAHALTAIDEPQLPAI